MSRDTCTVEDDDVFVASCSNRTAFLIPSGCSSFAVSHSLLPTWILSLCYRRVVCPPRQMRPHVDPPSASRFPASFRTSPAPLSARAPFLSVTHTLSRRLCVCVCIHPCLTRQSSFDNRSASFSTFVVVRFCCFSVSCQRCTTWTTSSVTMSLDVSRQHLESSWLNLPNSFLHSSWQWRSCPFSVSCDFLCKLQFRSHHLPRPAAQAVPVRRVPGIAQCMSRPTFASHNSVLGNAQNYSHSIMMTDKHSLSHAALQMNLHHLLQFYGTKLSLQIAPVALFIFVQFVSVCSFFHLYQFSSCS